METPRKSRAIATGIGAGEAGGVARAVRESAIEMLRDELAGSRSIPQRGNRGGGTR